MPKKSAQQTSLDSFFGTGGPAKKQKTLTSFFASKNKENNGNLPERSEPAPVHQDDMEEDIPKSRSRKGRQAIVDDDDDDEEEVTQEKTVEGSVSTPATDTDTEPKAEPPTAKTVDKTPPIKPTPSAKAVVPKEDKPVLKPAPLDAPLTPSMKKLLSQAAQLAKEAKVPTTDKLPALESPVLYQDLVNVLDQIEAVSGRLEIQALLTTFLRQLLRDAPQDLYSAVYLASNSIAPAYECVELGIGDSILMKAIAEAYGTKASFVKEKYEEEGDLGTVAQSFKGKQRTLSFGIKPKPLTVQQVLKIFREIANITGSQSQKLKVNLIKKMLVAVQQTNETKYIIRGLQGKLRIGLAQSTVLIALAHAFSFTVPMTVTPPVEEEDEDEEIKEDAQNVFLDTKAPIEKRLEAAANIVKQVYSEVPSYDALLDAALRVPLANLHSACSFQPGIPVVPMLAKPTKSIQEVLSRLNGLKFTCEFKYDGERAQIHKTPTGELKVFSRNLLETSAKYPEVPLFVQEAAAASPEGTSATSFVLDAEVVAYNPQTDKLVPFQVLSTRKKSEESAETAKVQVIVQAFDLMYLNGKNLLSHRLEERRTLMKQHFAPVPGKFQYAKALDFVEDGDTTALEQFLDASVKGQCEGLMVKTMDDVYEPSRRSLNWLKLKKDYLDGVGDSFDLVPLGAYYGRGKRTGVYGAYLLACYDVDSEEFQSVCKLGTGFSDEDLQTLSASLNEHKIEVKSSQYNVSDSLECDVWFDAVQVWEIKAADLSKSSTHRGAIDKTGEADRGIGLRFPRFERVRDDKKPEQATNSDQVLEMYYNQDTVKGQDDNMDDDDDGI
eukprot:Nitzschia sp. Nitz4//scaffold65_size103378//35545//38141//NITZ4_004463-RA/size103378-augustus-gene-0.79-mRNA-1//1//CDS//3329556231//2713//frame0